MVISKAVNSSQKVARQFDHIFIAIYKILLCLLLLFFCLINVNHCLGKVSWQRNPYPGKVSWLGKMPWAEKWKGILINLCTGKVSVKSFFLGRENSSLERYPGQRNLCPEKISRKVSFPGQRNLCLVEVSGKSSLPGKGGGSMGRGISAQ
jgi:hypothetical protein